VTDNVSDKLVPAVGADTLLGLSTGIVHPAGRSLDSNVRNSVWTINAC
jgi:hypothetical protein